jgi:hypothetical protein
MREMLKLRQFLLAGFDLLIETKAPILTTLDSAIDLDNILFELFDFLEPIIKLLAHSLEFLNQCIFFNM